jgi:hypothetical protein
VGYPARMSDAVSDKVAGWMPTDVSPGVTLFDRFASAAGRTVAGAPFFALSIADGLADLMAQLAGDIPTCTTTSKSCAPPWASRIGRGHDR